MLRRPRHARGAEIRPRGRTQNENSRAARPASPQTLTSRPVGCNRSELTPGIGRLDSDIMPKPNSANGSKLVSALAILAFSMCVAVTGWTARELVQLRTNVAGSIATIEARDRFTPADGLEVWKRIGQLEVAAAGWQPPVWLASRLDALDTKVDRLATTVSRLASAKQPLDAPHRSP